MEQAVSARVSESLARIESDIRAIWAPDEEGHTKPHATTLNLIAVHGQRDGAAFASCIHDVAARLGARTFLVVVDPRLEPWTLDGDVSAVCSVEPGSGRETACAERVELSFGAMVAKRAASIIDALIESSLPTALVIGPGAHGSVVDALASSSECVILDSSDTGLARACEIVEEVPGRVDDLSFVRIRRWRDMTARFFDDPELRGALSSIEKIVLRHVRRHDHAGASAEAELLVAWMGARLGWKPNPAGLSDAAGHPIQIQIDEIERDNVTPGSLVALEVHATVDARPLVGRAVREDDGEHLSWELEAPDRPRVTRRFSTPRRDVSELVERAMRNTLGEGLVRETLEFARRWRAGR